MTKETVQGEYLFVEFSKGEYEGTFYDNVLLSNGVRTLKCKNLTDEHALLAVLKPEVDKVTATIEYHWGKNGVEPRLVKIAKLK